MVFTSALKLRVFHEGYANDMPFIGFRSIVEYASFENEPLISALDVLQRLFPNLQRLSLRERPKIVGVLETFMGHPEIWSHLQLLEAPVASDAEVERFSSYEHYPHARSGYRFWTPTRRNKTEILYL
jgi:hypothetical protein